MARHGVSGLSSVNAVSPFLLTNPVHDVQRPAIKTTVHYKVI